MRKDEMVKGMLKQAIKIVQLSKDTHNAADLLDREKKENIYVQSHSNHFYLNVMEQLSHFKA